MGLTGNERVLVTGVSPTGALAASQESVTTQDIANLSPGGSVPPSPFFGTALIDGWTRPGLDIGGSTPNCFTTILNPGGQAVGVGTAEDSPPYSSGAPIDPGTDYAPGDTITLAGGTIASDSNLPTGTATVLTVDTVDGGGGLLTAHISASGRYSVPPTGTIGQSSSSGSGTGATWNVAYSSLATVTCAGSNSPILNEKDRTLARPIVVTGFTDPGMSGGYLTAALMPIGAAPWTVTLGEAISMMVDIGTSFFSMSAPIVLYDSGSDTAICFFWNAGGYQVARTYNPTAPGNAPSTDVESKLMSNSYDAWFKAVNDGSNIAFSSSSENFLYNLFTTLSALAFDYVGFGMDRAITSNSNSIVGDKINAVLWNGVQTSS